MKLARMVASSVCGRWVYTQMAMTQTRTALITMAWPSLFPMTLRLPEESFASAINLTPEKKQPGTQRNQNPQTEIDQGDGAQVRFDSGAKEDATQQEHTDDPKGDTEHPRRKKRTDQINGRSGPAAIKKEQRGD